MVLFNNGWKEQLGTQAGIDLVDLFALGIIIKLDYRNAGNFTG